MKNRTQPNRLTDKSILPSLDERSPMRDYKDRPLREPSLWEIAEPPVKASLIAAGLITASWLIAILLFSLERLP